MFRHGILVVTSGELCLCPCCGPEQESEQVSEQVYPIKGPVSVHAADAAAEQTRDDGI